MERTLLLLAFALGGVVWLCGFLSARAVTETGKPPNPVLPRFWLWTALALPIVLFLATWPSKPAFFAAGHGLGTGFLIGGLAGLLGIVTIIRALQSAGHGDPVSRAAAVAAPIGLSLMAATAPCLWLRDSLLDALCGVAIGWLCAVLLCAFGMLTAKQNEVDAAARLCMTLSAGTVTLFCALGALGDLRGTLDIVSKVNDDVHWNAPGLVFAAVVCVILLLALLPPHFALKIPLVPRITGWFERGLHSDEAKVAAGNRWRFALCTLAALIVGRILSARFTETTVLDTKTKAALHNPVIALWGISPIFHVIVLGLAAGLIAWWLITDRKREERDWKSLLPGGQGNALAVLTLVAASMLAFQMLKGYGVSLLLISVLLMAGLAAAAGLSGLEERTQETSPAASSSLVPAASQFTRLFLLGVVIALYRLFTSRFDSELRGVGLTDHYALFGLLFGAMLPPFLTGFLMRVPTGSADSSGARLMRLAVTGLLVLALPTVVLALWGAKCALALLIGLALSTVFETSLYPALFSLAVALAMTQWTSHVLPLAELTRDQKIHTLYWGAGIAIVLMLAAEYGGRLRLTPGKSSPAESSSTPAKGAAR